jgi:hypothetical protein
VARKVPSIRRKVRTREHVIAELAVNHVERQALLCGYSVERVVHDYGIDLILFTYSPEGETENDTVARKAGEKVAKTGRSRLGAPDLGRFGQMVDSRDLTSKIIPLSLNRFALWDGKSRPQSRPLTRFPCYSLPKTGSFSSR